MSLSPLKRRLLIIPPVVLGMAAIALALSQREPPARSLGGEIATPVRVVVAEPAPFVPRAIGFGEARPARVWAAVAEVSGRVTMHHPKLRDGEFIDKDEVLLQIDPSAYALRVAQTAAELAELKAGEGNTLASLAIEQRGFKLAGEEFERLKRLARNGSTSASSVDAAERAMLIANASVQNMRNSLDLIPSQRAALNAKLAEAERDLANTRIKAPFNLRVAAAAVELDQFVQAGQKLFEGDAIDRVEVIAQFAPRELRRLIVGQALPFTASADLTTGVARIFGHAPVVRLDTGESTAVWQASFLRLTDRVDAATRTVGLVVGVTNPWGKVIPGVRPPLTKGMFVEVELSAPAMEPRVVVPRTAIRDGKVYLSSNDNRLTSQAVSIAFYQGDIAVLNDNTLAGQRVVVSDVIPAIEGMLLAPQTDDSLSQPLASGGLPQ